MISYEASLVVLVQLGLRQGQQRRVFVGVAELSRGPQGGRENGETQ